jgi:hypothetical protein
MHAKHRLIVYLKQQPAGNRRGVMQTGSRTWLNQKRFGAKSQKVVYKTPFFLTRYIGSSSFECRSQPLQRKMAVGREIRTKDACANGYVYKQMETKWCHKDCT